MKNFPRNIAVLCVAVCLSASCFAGVITAAQTKTSAKTSPTPNNQKSPAKSAPKTKTAATPVPKKTTTKVSDKPKSSDAVKSKDSDKSKTASKSSPQKSKPASSATTKSAASSREKIASAKSAPTVKPTNAKPTAKTVATAKTAATTKTTVEKSLADSKPPAKTTTPKTDAVSSSQIIVAATSARVRSEPTAGASVVSTVNVGKIFPVVEENSIWYRVRLADDRSGWISKQIAIDFDDAKRDEIYQKILAKYSKSKMDFATAAQIFDFLTTASGEMKKPDAQADFSFKRLQVLSAALKAVPSGKGDVNPYKNFLNANEKEVVYSEPSGEWYVRSDVFWETHARFKDSPVGEEIAWAAAQTPLPGECEGYVNCYIYLLRVTDGEYLNFYPGGKYALKSIQNITSLLDPIVADLKNKTVYTAATDISDRAEFNRLLTELRQIISKVPFVEKAKAIQQINQIGEGFR